MLGTGGNSKGIQKHPSALGDQSSAVQLWRWKEPKGTSSSRGTQPSQWPHSLKRVRDLKNSGRKIRNNRRMRVLNARQLRNDSWKQTREEQEGSNSFKKKFFFFFFLREDSELAKFNSPGLFSPGAKCPKHLNRP